MDKNLYGKSVTENIYKNIQNKLDKSIKLTIVLVGNRQDSLTYVNIKKKVFRIRDRLYHISL